MRDWLKAYAPPLGGVAAAAGSALCCAAPIIAVAAGVSGAGLAATFEPMRPWFLGATALLLALGFYQVYATPAEACLGRGRCETMEDARRKRRREKAILWTATTLAAVLATFPTWSAWLT